MSSAASSISLSFLSEGFYKCFQAWRELDKASSSQMNPSYQSSVQSLVSDLSRLHDEVSRQALFSSNEVLGDISTTNLKFALIPYFLADLELKVQLDNQRLAHLRKASV